MYSFVNILAKSMNGRTLGEVNFRRDFVKIKVWSKSSTNFFVLQNTNVVGFSET